MGQWSRARCRRFSCYLCASAGQRPSRFSLVEADQPSDKSTSQCRVAYHGPLCDCGPANVLEYCVFLSCWVTVQFSTHLIVAQCSVSATVVGLYTSYAMPILLRITTGRKSFIPGPFHLGRYSIIIGTIAVAWATFMGVLLLFPFTSRLTSANDMSLSEYLHVNTMLN